jgi:cell division protein FtsB
MSKYIITVFLFVILVVAILQFLNLKDQRQQLKEELATEQLKIDELEGKRQQLISEINYFENNQNLEKEFKSRFNYRQPDEKLYILVP